MESRVYNTAELYKMDSFGGENVREWLKNIRKEKKLTMKEVGAALGVSESYYCAIENGERQKRMDVTFAIGLAKVLGIGVAELIRLEAENPQ